MTYKDTINKTFNLWIVFYRNDSFKAIYMIEENAMSNCNDSEDEWILATANYDEQVKSSVDNISINDLAAAIVYAKNTTKPEPLGVHECY
jgi:hypothetical protein